MLNMHVMYIIKSGPKRVCRKGSTENITGPKKTGPKTKVGRKVTNPKILSTETETMSLCH